MKNVKCSLFDESVHNNNIIKKTCHVHTFSVVLELLRLFPRQAEQKKRSKERKTNEKKKSTFTYSTIKKKENTKQ